MEVFLPVVTFRKSLPDGVFSTKNGPFSVDGTQRTQLAVVGFTVGSWAERARMRFVFFRFSSVQRQREKAATAMRFSGDETEEDEIS